MNIDEVLRWLECADAELTLVGGQSVALWEHLLGLPILTETIDIDFLEDPSQAQELSDALGYRCLIPDSADLPPNTAAIVDDCNVVVADFLGSVAGLNETDILRRRIPIALDGGHTIHVLHPFDCLASRLSNIALLPAKRSPRGFDQPGRVRIAYRLDVSPTRMEWYAMRTLPGFAAGGWVQSDSVRGGTPTRQAGQSADTASLCAALGAATARLGQADYRRRFRLQGAVLP